MLFGPPGLGKTTLAHILANELKVPFYPTSAPSIDKAGDLAGVLAGLKSGSLLFIDEVHRLSTQVEEILYKKEKKTKHDLGREKFLNRVEKFAEESHDTIVKQIKKMGASVDWRRIRRQQQGLYRERGRAHGATAGLLQKRIESRAELRCRA